MNRILHIVGALLFVFVILPLLYITFFIFTNKQQRDNMRMQIELLEQAGE